jgi:hypothetical protein
MILGMFLLCSLAGSLAAQAPTPEVTGKPLAKTKTEVEGATKTVCKIDPLGAFPCPGMLMPPDGKNVFLFTREGVIQKISLSEFTEERRLTTGRNLGPLALCQDGLVVMNGQKNAGLDFDPQLWIIDLETLTLQKSVKTEASSSLSALPDSKIVVTANPIAKAGDYHLLITDLKTEKAPKEISASRLNKEAMAHLKKTKMSSFVPREWGELKLSAGAKYLFNRTGAGVLSRLEFKGGDPAYEEVGPLLSFVGPYAISADAKWVAVTVRKGPAPKDHPDPGEFGVYAYKIDNLQKPAASVPNAEFLAFGADNRLIVRLAGVGLGIFDTTGKKEKQINVPLVKVPESGAFGLQCFIDATGKRLLLRFDDELSCIDLGN